MVASSDILLQAIYALASRQLSNLGRFDPAAAEAYHEKCMRVLIHALEPSSATVKDHLFAATVILRTKEEFDSASPISDFSTPVFRCPCLPSLRTRDRISLFLFPLLKFC